MSAFIITTQQSDVYS